MNNILKTKQETGRQQVSVEKGKYAGAPGLPERITSRIFFVEPKAFTKFKNFSNGPKFS